MKLETTLDERPGFLHALPLFDLFMLVTMLLLLGPMFLNQSGVMVELPASQFQMQRYSESVVITLSSGKNEPQIYIGRQAVSMDILAERLRELKADKVMSRAIILLKTDVGVPVAIERKLIDLVLLSDFKLALIGESQQSIPLDNETDK